MFSPSTAPRWKMAMRTLRRPPLLTPCASAARRRNDGTICIAPTLASATPPDLRKNLLFIFTPSLPLKFGRAQNQADDFDEFRVADSGEVYGRGQRLLPAPSARRKHLVFIGRAGLKRPRRRRRERLVQLPEKRGFRLRRGVTLHEHF